MDAYARRIFSRLGFSRLDAAHGAIQQWVAAELGEDSDLYNEYHALIVALGKTTCRKRPRCDACPLQERCPRVGVEAAGER